MFLVNYCPSFEKTEVSGGQTVWSGHTGGRRGFIARLWGSRACAESSHTPGNVLQLLLHQHTVSAWHVFSAAKPVS